MKNETSPDLPVRLAASHNDGLSDNGLAVVDDNTHPKRFRRPGPWSVVPNFVLTSRRIRGLSATARALNLFGWVYANANRTDGEISADDVASIAAAMNIHRDEVIEAGTELVSAGLWEGAFQIVDFLKWCQGREAIERLHREGQERAEKWRRDQKQKGSPDLSQKQNATEATDSNRQQQKATGTYHVRTPYVLRPDGTPKAIGEID